MEATEKTKVIVLRMPQSEYDNVKEAARLTKSSMNKLIRQLSATGSTSILEAAIVSLAKQPQES